MMRSWLFLTILLSLSCHKNKPPENPTQDPSKITTNGTPTTKEEGGGLFGRNKESKAKDVYFEDGKDARPTDLAKDTFKIVSDYYKAIGAPEPFFDARLSSASTVFAENVPEGGALNRRFIDYYLSQQGIAEPYPKVVSFAFTSNAREDFLQKLGEAMTRIVPSAQGADLRVGVGYTEKNGKIHLILAMLPGRLLMDEVPRQVDPGETIRVGGSVAKAYRSPRLVITSPDGTTQTLRAQSKDASFLFEAALPNKGRYEVEIVADGASGPEVCGLFTVYSGIELPSAPTLVEPGRDKAVTADEAEKIIFDLVNEARKKAGLSPLLPLPSAQKVARAYSEEMRSTGKVGHISEISGKPEDRLKKGGVKSPLILENVARSYSPEDAHAGLMDSPGHRANVLNPKVTHLGVGVAVDFPPNSPPAYYVTEAFAKIGSDDPKKLAKDLGPLLQKARTEAGLAAMAEDTKLSELAARYLAKLESGEMTTDQIANAIFNDLSTTFNKTYQVGAPLVTPLPILEALSQAKGLADSQFTHYGAAITVTGKKSPYGEGQILLVLILAGSR